ncbi:ParA family protein [Geobacillus sp. FSL W8-0466]|uniref:ParA family protein n=1 Tax=Geobacillus sp. FSL W8-0466 TaxID=2975350 RepID=UPI0030D7D0C2
MVRVISLFNHKGGVSKTTTTFNLGWVLADLGYRVIMVDGDPQCNLTGMALDFSGMDDFEEFYEKNPDGNIKDALKPAFLSQPVSLQPVKCLEVSGRENLFVLPGHVGFAEYDVPLGIAHDVKADDKIPNIAGIKFPTYNRTIVSTRGAMVHDYERGIFYDQRDV